MWSFFRRKPPADPFAPLDPEDQRARPRDHSPPGSERPPPGRIPRPRVPGLLHPLLAVSLVAFPTVAAVVVFPPDRWSAVCDAAASSDEVAIQFAKIVLAKATDGTGDAKRLDLARALIASGRPDEAALLVTPLLERNDVEGAEARMLRLFATLPGSADGERDRTVLSEAVRELLEQPLRAVDLERLAKLVEARGHHEIAAEIHTAIGRRVGSRRDESFAKAVDAFHAASNPERAGELLSIATAQERRAEKAIPLAMQAVKSFRSAARGDRALTFIARTLEDFPENTRLLAEGVDVALEQSRLDLASEWSRRLGALSDDSVIDPRRQIAIEIAAGDPAAAARVARRVVERSPEDGKIRLQLARSLTWSGQGEDAYEHWLWLARKNGSREAREAALRGAVAFHDDESLVELLILETAGRPPTSSESAQLLAAFERLGEIDRAEELLVARLEQSPGDQPTMKALVDLRLDSGDLDGALEIAHTWLGAAKSKIAPAVAVAKLQAALGDDAVAVGTLLAIKDEVRQSGEGTISERESFWKLLAHLGWSTSRLDIADEALAALWNGGSADVQTARRRRLIAIERGDARAGIAISREAWKRLEDDDMLELAAEAAASAELWSTLKTLLVEAESADSPFTRTARFWSLRAAIRRETGDRAGELDAYQRALTIDPEDRSVRTALAWRLLEADRLRELREQLAVLESHLESDRDLWALFAVALRKLSRVSESLAFYERHARERPEDFLWTLSWADALESLGRNASAAKLRQHTLTHAVRSARRALDSADEDRASEELAIAYATLVRRHRGADEAEVWLDRLAADVQGPSALRAEFAITWFLADGRIDHAREWMLADHARRLQRPAWLRLSVALAEEDLGAIAGIVEETTRPDGLAYPDRVGRVDRIEGMRRYEADDRALPFALDQLWRDEPEVQPDNEQLLRHATSMYLDHPNGARLRGRFDELGELSLLSLEAGLIYSRQKWTLESYFAQYQLDGTSLLDARARDLENDLSIAARWRSRSSLSRVLIGLNVDERDALPYTRLTHEHAVHTNHTARVEIAVNDLATESDALRIAGARDHIDLSWTALLTQREYATGLVSWSDYHDRDHDRLGQGILAELSLGHKLHLGNRVVDLRAVGSWFEASLASTLPPDIREIVPATRSVDSVLAERFGSVGFAASLRHGNPGEWSPDDDSIRYLLDLWAGWVFPLNQFAYNARVAIGVDVFHRDELSLGVVYSDAASGLADQGTVSFTVQYVHRFGS